MRHMLRLDWSVSLRRLSIALVLGVVAMAGMTYLPMHLVHRGKGASVRQVRRGVHEWWHARDAVFGVRWSNLMLNDQPLSIPMWDGEMHGWEEPPPPPYPVAQFVRIGTLAVGWPLPTVAMRWTVTSTNQSFPVPAELDDADTSLPYAVESATTGRRGGKPQEIRLLWMGIAFNTVFYGAVLVGPLALARRLARRTAPAGTSG
jgi:hypothetical protein